MTFPGKVTEASGKDPDISGSTVTWDLTKETDETLHAEGKDSDALWFMPSISFDGLPFVSDDHSDGQSGLTPSTCSPGSVLWSSSAPE